MSGNSAQQKALHLFSRGFGGRAIDGRNIYFLFSYFFPNMSGISVCLPCHWEGTNSVDQGDE